MEQRERSFSEIWAERMALARFNGERLVISPALARQARKEGACMVGVTVAGEAAPSAPRGQRGKGRAG